MSQHTIPGVSLSHRQVLLQDRSIAGVVTSSYGITQQATAAIQALNVLQYTSDAKTSSECIDKAMQFHLNYMGSQNLQVTNAAGGKPPPPDVSVYYTTHKHAELNNLFVGMFDPNYKDVDFDAANTVLDNHPEFLNKIKTHNYTIWPINVNLHWVAIVLHTVWSDSYKAHVVNAMIADPERHATTTGFVWSRLKKIFNSARGFYLWNKDNDTPQPLWYPKQEDDFSCGLRVYQIMKTMLERINEASLRACTDGIYDHMWDDLSCDFNADKVRAEMIGILATEALREQNWHARIVITPCVHVEDGHGNGPTHVYQGSLAHQPSLPLVTRDFSPEVSSRRLQAAFPYTLLKPKPAPDGVKLVLSPTSGSTQVSAAIEALGKGLLGGSQQRRRFSERLRDKKRKRSVDEGLEEPPSKKPKLLPANIRDPHCMKSIVTGVLAPSMSLCSEKRKLWEQNVGPPSKRWELLEWAKRQKSESEDAESCAETKAADERVEKYLETLSEVLDDGDAGSEIPKPSGRGSRSQTNATQGLYHMG